MSDLCDEYDLQPSQIYRWQKQLFENVVAAEESRIDAGFPDADLVEKRFFVQR